jgi:arsenate reductase
MRLYHYPNCSTCKKAIKFLDGLDLDYELVNISENPPSSEELTRMLELQLGNLRRLFNTSGQVYRELAMKDRLPGLEIGEALEILSCNGMLVKRPFLISEGLGLVGFREEEWSDKLSR